MSLLAAAAQVDKIPADQGKAATGLKISPSDGGAAEFARSDARRGHPPGARPHRLPPMLKESSDPDDQERLANIEELITAANQFHAEDNSAPSPISWKTSRWPATSMAGTRSRTASP